MKSRLILVVVMVMAIMTFGIEKTVIRAATVFEVDREFFPYYPSLLKWNKSTAEFTPPETCGDCHEKQYREWTGSVHALAFQDPVYQGELNKAFKAVGHTITRQCEGCHSPAGVLTGEIKGPGIKALSPMALAGVSCDICHSVSDVTHWRTPSREPENGSMILTPGIETKDGTVLVKRGPNKPSEDCGGGFHQCVKSPLHLTADVCASCHQVFHYDAHFPLEATYREWKHSPYAQKNILCQDCHMVDSTLFKRAADQFRKPAGNEYRHYFNGANYLLYYLAAGAAAKAGNKELAAILKEKYEMAVERLKSAAEVTAAPIYRRGELAEVAVRVTNIRAGHHLPTSLTNVRQMWLEITARDDQGKILVSSGLPNRDGKLPADTRTFNSDGMGNDFHFAVDPWIVTAFSRHETIPPRGYKEVFYGLTAPKGSKRITLEIKLRYRQADQKLAEALLGAVPQDVNLEEIYGLREVPTLPVVDMVVTSITFDAQKKGSLPMTVKTP